VSISRRDLGLLLPALAAASAVAQEPAAQQSATQLPATPHPAAQQSATQQPAVETMTSKAYTSDQIPYKGDDKKKGRQFFLAATHAGFKIECHETVLGAGLETHPPHKHEHEEIMIVVAGTVEANMDGVKQTVPAGSVVVFGSNQTHNARNAGTTPSRYYIVELRGNEA
jgi:XRE family transcriptional regulator, regulator of sulfur utilization